MELIVNEYLSALSVGSQDVLKEFLKALDSGKPSVIQSCAGQLSELITESPYPVLQILACHLQKSKFHIGLIVAKALKAFLVSEGSGKKISLNYISFLANFPMHILEAKSLSDKQMQLLTSSPLDNKIYLALLSRDEPFLLERVLSHCEKCWGSPDNEPTKESILFQVIANKSHFIERMCSQLSDFRFVSDVAVRNNMLILKIANEFSNTTQTLDQLGDTQRLLQELSIDKTPPELLDIHKFFYADFKRMSLFVEFLKRRPESFSKIKISSLLTSTSILEILYEYDIHTSLEDLRVIISSVHSWQQQLPSGKSLQDLEMETLNYYTALSTVFDIIMGDSNSGDQFYNSKIQKLNSVLRQIRNIDVMCALIEDFLHLVFLRWEHLPGKPESSAHDGQRGVRTPKSCSMDSCDDSNDSDAERNGVGEGQPVGSGKHGFICGERALYMLFSYLKTFLTKKLHSDDYKQSLECLQIRFQHIVSIIAEALWKYTVLEKINEAHTANHGQRSAQYLLEPEELLHLVQKHSLGVEKCSSDDDSKDRSNYASLSRRKAAKKRRRATFSGGSAFNLEKYRNRRSNVTIDGATDIAANSVGLFKSKTIVAQYTDRSIIPKMLGPPQILAMMALVLKNFNDVKYIIETFNLQNSSLNVELNFVERQQQVKQKLDLIYSNYKRQEQSSKCNRAEPKATVEQIRNVAAKGFEVSKIISVIDNFAQQQRIEQSAELKQLLHKYCHNNPQYGFLRQFEESNLNAIIITDLILNLPFNHEITSNVLMVIKRQQQISAGIVTTQSNATAEASTMKVPAKSSILRHSGAMTFLENVCECLRILEQKDSNASNTGVTTPPPPTLQDLLSDNYYSLHPHKLCLELEREHAFNAIFYRVNNEFAHPDDLRSYVPLFAQLNAKTNYYGRFYAYVANLSKLLHLRDPNLEYHISELLKLDTCDIIGELIYECDMTPLEIESNVSALNLNLVHVIALNICPEIVGKAARKPPSRMRSPQKEQTILNYILNQNKLLAFLLGWLNESDRLFVDKLMMNSVYLKRLLELKEIENLSVLYNKKKLVAALRSDNLDMALLEGHSSKHTQLDILMLKLGNRDNGSGYSKIIDNLVQELINEDAQNMHLIGHITDVSLKAKLIFKHFTKIGTTRLAKELIECTLQNRAAATRISTKLREQLENTLADITVYAKVSEVMQFETWPQVYDFGLKTPNAIFEKLLQLHLYKLCYKWCKVVKLAEQFGQYKRSFLEALMNAMLELNDDQANHMEFNKYLLLILETFPVDDCVEFLDTNKTRFRSLALLNYVVDYLIRNDKNGQRNCTNYKIAIGIVEQLAPRERDQFWSVMSSPLLIIEQLIMNAKFEVLTKVLAAVRKSLQQLGVGSGVCSYCFNKQGNVYDIHGRQTDAVGQKVHLQLSSSLDTSNSAFILLSYNLYQKDHIIRNECIDLLLRIYATKALDYHVAYLNGSSEHVSQNTDFQNSLDSLCGAFQIPKVVPSRDEWIRDEEATHCMCCRRAVFTILCRRHHCRRCGRVVCYGCSTHRMKIPELYAEVEVRICNDCHRNNEEESQRKNASAEGSGAAEGGDAVRVRSGDQLKWKLSGKITHDKVVREEFCYEHAPSVALCLSILGYHMDQQKCVELLLYHCRILEKLIVPNPEIDYELLAKMINCLALAAKVRLGPPEIETIREHSEIIMAVVQNGCESLLPPGPLNNYNLRKLGDALIQAEKWRLALDIHLKCGFSTAGVMAAHGFSALKAGCFDTAREKFSHCMPKLSNELVNMQIMSRLQQSTNCDSSTETSGVWCKSNDIPIIKRPQRGPPLLQEILKTIETMSSICPQPETLKRASVIRSSNSSLASIITRKKEHSVIPMHEPAINILSTLDNLKRIASGDYADGGPARKNQRWHNSRAFEEGMHYILTYGSHADILKYLVQFHDLSATLEYFLLQNLDPDLFIHHIYLRCLHWGTVPELIAQMLAIDSRLMVFQNVLLLTCRYLEKENLLNSLYQLQLQLKDPVRASMTCVKFYTMNCENFQQLHANAQHLHNAHQHLQSELEISQWENINIEQSPKRKGSLSGRRLSTASLQSKRGDSPFLMQMDAAALNAHINTILRQLEVAKFLAKCERDNSAADSLVTTKIIKQIRIETGPFLLPTLFDKVQDKIQICVLLLYCGKNVEEGFGLAYRIMQDYKLAPMKVFNATAKYFARNQRLAEVEKLINCITSNNGHSNRELDEVISIAINSATNNHEPDVKAALDVLTKRIHNVELRISSHIFIGQLKSAYLLANKYERLADIRKILRQAEITNQMHIKKLCERKLQMSSGSTSAGD